MTGPQIVAFGNLIFQILLPATLSETLQRMNRPALDRIVTTAFTPREQISQLIGIANTEGWIRQLVDAVVAGRGQIPEVRAFLVNNPDFDSSRNYVPQNPWATYKIFGGKFFLGRGGLRRHLFDMCDPLNSKVLLVISDQRQVGKSYTAGLIQFVSDYVGMSKVSYIDLDAFNYDLDTFAKRIAKEWGIDPEDLPGPGGEQESRWGQYLGKYLIEHVERRNGTVQWLILDGFREKILPQAMLDLVTDLAQRIQSDDLFRLILVDFTQQLPLDVQMFMLSDTVGLLSDDEIRTALRDLAAMKGPALSDEQSIEYLELVKKRRQAYSQQYAGKASDQAFTHYAVSDVVKKVLWTRQ
jgi:hypothetical protein